MTEFDPANHRMVPAQAPVRGLCALGERFVPPGRTQTTAIFAAFQAASGDTHPIHYDVEYCRTRGMPHLLVHGFQTLVHTVLVPGCFPSSPKGCHRFRTVQQIAAGLCRRHHSSRA